MIIVSKGSIRFSGRHCSWWPSFEVRSSVHTIDAVLRWKWMERNIIFVIFVFSCLPDGSKVNCNHVNAFPPGDSSLCCGILLLVSFCVGKPSKTCRPRPQFWINLSAGSRHHRPRQIRPRTHHHKTQINQSMETCGEFVFVVYILDF